MSKSILSLVMVDEVFKYLKTIDHRITVFLANESKIRLYEHLFVALAFGYMAERASKWSVDDVKQLLWRWSRTLFPKYHKLILDEISEKVDNVIKESFGPIEGLPEQKVLPKDGLSSKEVLKRLKLLHDSDIDPKKGKLFAYVYPINEKHEKLVVEAQNMFIHLNALNPVAFPSLRRMEIEVVQMTISMLNGGSECRGTMTSGGTESILLAMKSYRDMGRDQWGITSPEVVLPITAHPAFHKAAKYFGLKLKYIPVDPVTFRVDLVKFEKAITRNTVLLVGSAPQYPHGVLDPIEDLGKIALKRRIPLHVDACIGGFFLPFINTSKYPVPPFDYRVAGVTSMSADIHKYGYATKGSSVLSFSSDRLRKYQFMAYTGWPGGVFVSPSVLGTRAGGNIAAAWTSLVSMGIDGFQEIVGRLMETSKNLQSGIKAIQGLDVLGSPVMSCIAFRTVKVGAEPTPNIHAVADCMQSKYGWKLERQHLPDCVHMTLTSSHIGCEDVFLANLKDSLATVVSDPSLSNKGSAAMYSGISNIPLTEIADEFLTEFISRAYSF